MARRKSLQERTEDKLNGKKRDTELICNEVKGYVKAQIEEQDCAEATEPETVVEVQAQPKEVDIEDLTRIIKMNPVQADKPKPKEQEELNILPITGSHKAHAKQPEPKGRPSKMANIVIDKNYVEKPDGLQIMDNKTFASWAHK